MTKTSHTVISSNLLSLCVSTSDQRLGLIYCCCSAFGAGFWNEESLTMYLSSETCSNITSQAARPATSTWNSSSPIKGQETLQRGYLVLLERAQPAELSCCAAAVGWIWFVSQSQLPSHLQKRGAHLPASLSGAWLGSSAAPVTSKLTPRFWIFIIRSLTIQMRGDKRWRASQHSKKKNQQLQLTLKFQSKSTQLLYLTPAEFLGQQLWFSSLLLKNNFTSLWHKKKLSDRYQAHKMK